MFNNSKFNIYPDKIFRDIQTKIFISNNIDFKNKISFYGVEPASQQLADYSVESIVNLLRAYGLSSTISEWYLQEGPFKGYIGPDPPYFQGFSVDINGNGNVIIVGGPGYTPSAGQRPNLGNDDYGLTGSAWIFTRDNNGIWKQITNLIADDSSGAESSQGWSVSISNDGNTVAVGAPGDEIGGFKIGATWIYQNISGTWTQIDKLVGTGYNADKNGSQGFSVALSGDGNTLVVGAPRNEVSISSPIYNGTIWIFTNVEGSWVQQAGPLTPLYSIPSIESVLSAQTLSISDDGNTIAVPSILLDDNDSSLVFIYTRIEGIWSIQQEIVGGSSNANYVSVSLSGDGNTLAVGTPLSGNNESVNIYNRINNEWFLEQTLSGTGLSNTQGETVSLNEDGTTVIFTGFTSSLFSLLWVFRKNDEGMWIQIGNDIETTSTFSTNISKNGKTAVLGTSPDGEIYIYGG